MMSTTLSSLSTSVSSCVAIPWPELLNKRSVQRIVQVRQVRSGKSRKDQIRQQNRTRCWSTWLLTSVICYLFPSDENDENSKTGKDEQHTKVIMGKIWQTLLSFDTRSLTTKTVYTLKNHFLSVNGNKFLVKTKLNSRIPLFFSCDSRIPSP